MCAEGGEQIPGEKGAPSIAGAIWKLGIVSQKVLEGGSQEEITQKCRGPFLLVLSRPARRTEDQKEGSLLERRRRKREATETYNRSRFSDGRDRLTYFQLSLM